MVVVCGLDELVCVYRIFCLKSLQRISKRWIGYN